MRKTGQTIFTKMFMKNWNLFHRQDCLRSYKENMSHPIIQEPKAKPLKKDIQRSYFVYILKPPRQHSSIFTMSFQAFIFVLWCVFGVDNYVARWDIVV